MTRRLDGYRRSTAGVLLCLVAIASVSPLVFLASPARAEFREVGMVDDEFEPSEIVIQRGDTIVWVHRGVRPHGVRATDGSFESSPGCSFQNGEACMRNGERYSRTFDQAGTFTYYCPVHGSANGVGMAGQITVASGSGGGGTTTTTAPPSTTQTTRSGGTTVRPPTTGGSTTNAPGTPTTPPTQPPPGGSAPPAATTETAPGANTTVITVPSQNPDSSTSTLAIGTPEGSDGDSGGLIIGIAAAVVLAAAISAMAWYYRPANRRPGGPPPPIPPA